jgi:hypothetical protein
MRKFPGNVAKPVLTALAVIMAGTALPAAAQPDRYDWRSGDRGDREDFWRGAPDRLQERIDWLQQRIDRGIADGSIDRREARDAQYQLNRIRRDADMLDRQLDDVSRRIRWYRRDNDYGYRDPRYRDPDPRYRDPYPTDWDAYRYYRDDPRYDERRLGPDDEIYRGSDGRYYCRRSDGTIGLVIGGIGGAAIGNVIDG